MSWVLFVVVCHRSTRALRLPASHLDAIVSWLGEADFVELSQDALALGRRREDADG